MDIFFSIIVPTLNEEENVGTLLDDLAKQSFRSFEVIHVDGNSEDKTVEVVSHFANSLILTQIPAKRRNVSFQRNLGSDKACGYYLICIDADTRIPDPKFLATLHKHCIRSDRDTYFPRTIFDAHTYGIKCAEIVNNAGILLSQMIGRPLPTSALAVFKKSFFHKIGGYAVHNTQDKKGLFVDDQEILVRGMQHGMTSEIAYDIAFIFSLRRFKKDGWFRVLAKVLVSSLSLRTGKPASNITYEMGGQHYKKCTTRK